MKGPAQKKIQKRRSGKNEKKWRTIDFSEEFACHRKGEKIESAFTNTDLQNYG